MRILFKNVEVCCPGSKVHGDKKDIFLEYGKVKEVGTNMEEIPRTKILEGGILAPGFVNIGAFSGEPGFEQKETLQSLRRAAGMGGYTHVYVMPNLDPVTDDRSAVNFLKSTSECVAVQPLGAVSRNTEGEELADIYDMHSNGVRAFTDGLNPIRSIGMMKRALEYVKAFDGIVINQPFEEAIEPEARIHESEVSTEMGLKGSPVLAETSMLKRDIDLLQYTESRLAVYGVSAEKSIALIQDARKKDLRIFATVPFMNLVKESGDLITFNTHYLVNPPLRANTDRRALIKALKAGILDCIVSGHLPVEEDFKKVEFGHAEAGASTLPLVFPVLYEKLGNVFSMEDLIRFLSLGPRRLLSMEPVDVLPGSQVDYVWIDGNATTFYDEKSYPGRSKNSPFLGKTFKGKVKGVFRKDQYELF